jgi:hypothetical protein
MSLATTATWLGIAGLALAGTGTAISAVSGAKANANQQTALKNQTVATQTAEANALSTERKNETATNAANQRTPDISAILSQAANSSKVGIGSTMLTGAGGVNNSSLSLGKNTLLGS